MDRRTVIRIICLSVIFSCGSILAWQAHSEYQLNKMAEEARLAYERAMVQKKPAPQPTHTPALEPAVTEPPVRTVTTPAVLSPTPRAIQPAFEELRAKYGNNDIMGYLKIAGTGIDYPVTHSGDNSYYLQYDINKNRTTAGWIFMDYENDVEKDDPNIVIYGHNMRQDIMFHSLRYFQSWDYFNNHRYIEFNTIYENHVWEVFSFYRTDTDFPYIQVVFPSDEDFFALASEMKARSMYDTGVNIKPGDHILTLSTCTNEDDDTRFALNARRLSPDEIPSDFLLD
ncbi:MAG: class B sortase [Clostridiales bacterium]|nr:class B sortase [Clostridiales bacterium]